jgi:hypothetical protein
MTKLDLDSIVKNVKSLINPTGQTPQPNPDDFIGLKLAQLSASIQLVANIQVQQTKEFAKINKLANEVYALIEAQRAKSVVATEDKDADAL